MVGQGIDLKPSVPVGSQKGSVLLIGPVNVARVDVGRDLVVLLPHLFAAHRLGSEDVEALGGGIDPRKKPVRIGNGDGETIGSLNAGFAAIRGFWGENEGCTSIPEFLRVTLTVLRGQGDVVIEKLTPLHHHVRVPRIGNVGVRMIFLRDPSRIR